MRRVYTGNQSHQAVILGDRQVGRGVEDLGLIAFWAGIDDNEIASSHRGIEPAEHEVLRAWDIQERKIFRRRTDKNQILVLGIVERKQAASFHPQGMFQNRKYLVQFVNTENLAYTGVVVENRPLGIGSSIVVFHARLRAAHELGIAENHPGLVGAV